jgi:protein SCO1/2
MSAKTPVPYGTIVLFLFWGLLLAVLVLWMLPNKTIPPALQGILRPEPKMLQVFELIDQHEQSFSPERLRGKWSFVFFGYTYCPDICPTTLATLTAVVKQLKNDPRGLANIQVVFVSVDPQRDTPDLIEVYLKYFNEAFLGVTGVPQEIDALIHQFGAAYVREPETKPGEYLVSHSSSIFLVDPHTRLLAAFSPPHYPNTIVDQFRQIRSLF